MGMRLAVNASSISVSAKMISMAGQQQKQPPRKCCQLCVWVSQSISFYRSRLLLPLLLLLVLLLLRHVPDVLAHVDRLTQRNNCQPQLTATAFQLLDGEQRNTQLHVLAQLMAVYGCSIAEYAI